MIEKMAVNLVAQMAGKGIIDRQMQEYYVYAFVSMTERVITIGSILMISFLSGTVIPTLLFLVFFLSLRKRTGGFHLHSFLQCYFGTIAVYAVVLFVSRYLADCPPLLFGMLLLSACVIGVIGTVNHPNMHLDCMELPELKKAARIMTLLEMGVILFFCFIEVDMVYIGYMSVSIMVCAALMCLAKITGQEVKRNETDEQERFKGS